MDCCNEERIARIQIKLESRPVSLYRFASVHKIYNPIQALDSTQIMPSAVRVVSKIRILIADKYELIRHGVRPILRSERNAPVVGEAATGLELLDQARKLKPDVLIMDLAMPELDGIDAIRGIRKRIQITTNATFDELNVLNVSAHGQVWLLSCSEAAWMGSFGSGICWR
jgi:CheY-like chemotaxis protein